MADAIMPTAMAHTGTYNRRESLSRLAASPDATERALGAPMTSRRVINSTSGTYSLRPVLLSIMKTLTDYHRWHHMFTLLLDNKLFLAPIGPGPQVSLTAQC